MYRTPIVFSNTYLSAQPTKQTIVIYYYKSTENFYNKKYQDARGQDRFSSLR